MFEMVLGTAILFAPTPPAAPDADFKVAYAAEQRCRLPAPPRVRSASQIATAEAQSPNPGHKQYVSREQADADKALTCKT